MSSDLSLSRIEDTTKVAIEPKQEDGISVDILKVDVELKQNRIYKDDTKGIEIEFFDENIKDAKEISSEEELATKYVIKTSSYAGVVTHHLQKNFFGKYSYESKDWYIGGWLEDQKDGNGIYGYMEESATSKEGQYYFGEWKNGMREGKGIYLWKRPIDENVTENFDVIVGNFKEDNYIGGIRVKYELRKSGEVIRLIYRGKFDSATGIKDDENGLLIENNLVFKGKIENDALKEGRIAVFQPDDNTVKENSYYFTVDDSDEYNFDLEREEEADKVLESFIDKSDSFIEKIHEVIKIIESIPGKYQELKDFNKDSLTEEKLKEFETFKEVTDFDWEK